MTYPFLVKGLVRTPPTPPLDTSAPSTSLEPPVHDTPPVRNHPTVLLVVRGTDGLGRGFRI